jgi:hypothetical protein
MDIVSEKGKFQKSLEIDDFVPESRQLIQDFKCPLCDGIYMDPVVDPCAHVFCKQCILTHLSTTQSCPIQSQKYLDETHLNIFQMVQNILVKQSVLCKNRANNCGWVGRLQELTEHLNTYCARQIIQCPNNGCGSLFFREDVQLHLVTCDYRITPCEDCQVNIAFIVMKNHQEICPMFKLECPQGCGVLIQRKDIELHIQNDCLNTIIACPYAKFGCLTELTKREINEYLISNTNRHNLLVLQKFELFSNDVHMKLESISNGFSLKYQELFQVFQSQSSLLNSYQEVIPQLQEKIKNLEMTMSLISHQDTQRTGSNTENSPSRKKKEKKNENDSSSITSSPKRRENKFTNKKRQRTEEETSSKSIERVDLVSNLSNNIICEEENSPKSNKEKEKQENVISQNITKSQLVDMQNLSKGIYVSGNKIICQNNSKNEHKFAFANIVLNERDYEWKVTVNANSPWIGIGICNKDVVLENKLRFRSSDPKISHGAFLISINGYSWNCNLISENNVCIQAFPSVFKGDIIHFCYSPSTKELLFKVNNKFSGKLTNVYATKGTLCPCVVFINTGDEVMMELS